jgi:outer membrane protein assembly factor BamE (lipoprotein component of BamABCDE complex)
MRKMLQYFQVASMVLVLASCVNSVHQGHLKEDEVLSGIKPGMTTKEQVENLLGSPSSESTFGPKTWYYVSDIRENRSILPPKVVEQHVAEIAFDANGVVTSLKQYSLADGKNVQIATNSTPTEGQKLGFFEQVLGNLGRFNNNNDTGVSNSHTHGDTIPGQTTYPGR